VSLIEILLWHVLAFALLAGFAQIEPRVTARWNVVIRTYGRNL